MESFRLGDDGNLPLRPSSVPGQVPVITLSARLGASSPLFNYNMQRSEGASFSASDLGSLLPLASCATDVWKFQWTCSGLRTVVPLR